MINEILKICDKEETLIVDNLYEIRTQDRQLFKLYFEGKLANEFRMIEGKLVECFGVCSRASTKSIIKNWNFYIMNSKKVGE